MNAPAPKGWCPTVHAPMAAADGLIARVKPRVGGLAASQLRRIAEMAEMHGSGTVELSSRANLQVRGLSETGAAAFARAMIEAGLAGADHGAESRRNILAPPPLSAELRTFGEALESWLETSALPLPPKFSFTLAPDARPLPGDIVVRASPWRLGLDGSGLEAGTDRPLEAVQALVHAFLALAGHRDPPARRMRSLAAEAVFAHAGLETRSVRLEPPPPPPPVGPHAGGFGLGVAFGATDAGQLRTAAALAERFGSGRLVPTPARALHLAEIAPAHHDALATVAAQAGFIVAPTDPRLRVHACVGRPGCASAGAEVRADALRVASAWRGPGPLHLTGCAKGCAHPDPAATLVARAGGDGYDLIPHGDARTPPSRCGLAPDEALALLHQEPPASR